MSHRARRALVAAALPVLLSSADPAGAAACVPTDPQVCLPSLGSLGSVGGIFGTSDEGSKLCVFTKLGGDPPEGWGGAQDSPPPYVWTQTQDWGKHHEGQYDTMYCSILTCPPLQQEAVAMVLCPE